MLVHNTGVAPVKYHYTSAPEAAFQRGLWTHTSVTDNPNLTPAQAVRELGLKQLPDKIIAIRDSGHFRPNNPPIVQPHSRGVGGGTDFTNDHLVPPEDILPALPIGTGP